MQYYPHRIQISICLSIYLISFDLVYLDFLENNFEFAYVIANVLSIVSWDQFGKDLLFPMLLFLTKIGFIILFSHDQKVLCVTVNIL